MRDSKWRRIMGTPYKACAIANFFLERAGQEKPVTQMKVQKLVYFAHGWHLGITQKALINEQVEAWPYGPVIPSLYQELKRWGADPITELITTVEYRGSLASGKLELATPKVPEEDTETHELLEAIWAVYGQWTAGQLSMKTHEDGSPWAKAMAENSNELLYGTDIGVALLKEHFTKLAAG